MPGFRKYDPGFSPTLACAADANYNAAALRCCRASSGKSAKSSKRHFATAAASSAELVDSLDLFVKLRPLISGGRGNEHLSRILFMC